MFELRDELGTLAGVEEYDGDVVPYDTDAGQMLAELLEDGVPGFAPKGTDIIVEGEAWVRPSDPAFNLALVEYVEGLGWSVEEVEFVNNAFCKTGAGGGVDPTCGKFKKGTPSKATKADIAKANAKLVDKTIQRYAEERNEPMFAKAVGGTSLKNNEPADVVLEVGGKIRHGIELKTMVDNSNNKLTMKADAMAKKKSWERKNKATMHTVVLDDHAVFNAKGEGKHDNSKRRIFYRRGYGSFRVGTMHEVKGGYAELLELINKPKKELPEGAK